LGPQEFHSRYQDGRPSQRHLAEDSGVCPAARTHNNASSSTDGGLYPVRLRSTMSKSRLSSLWRNSIHLPVESHYIFIENESVWADTSTLQQFRGHAGSIHARLDIEIQAGIWQCTACSSESTGTNREQRFDIDQVSRPCAAKLDSWQAKKWVQSRK
jgi:hypothetical protein